MRHEQTLAVSRNPDIRSIRPGSLCRPTLPHCIHGAPGLPSYSAAQTDKATKRSARSPSRARIKPDSANLHAADRIVGDATRFSVQPSHEIREGPPRAGRRIAPRLWPMPVKTNTP
jgi:hypothetical protein